MTDQIRFHLSMYNEHGERSEGELAILFSDNSGVPIDQFTPEGLVNAAHQQGHGGMLQTEFKGSITIAPLNDGQELALQGLLIVNGIAPYIVINAGAMGFITQFNFIDGIGQYMAGGGSDPQSGKHWCFMAQKA